MFSLTALHRRAAALALAAATVLASAAPAAADGDGEAVVHRPMIADLHESLIRTRVFSVTQDLRYGSDITDSASTGGWLEDQRGVGWEIGAGKIFRSPAWTTAFGRRGPWRRYQLTASATLRSSFERYGASYLNVSDYQYGGGLEAQWSGAVPEGDGAFDRPVVTTRTALYHRSSHVADEYVAQGAFGRNQSGAGLLPVPPVKRTRLSHEVVVQHLAVEWSPRRGAATWRAYAGGEWKLGAMGRNPWNLRSPAAQLGLELRSAGNRAALGADPLSAALNRLVGEDRFAFTWIGAVDLRLARPFDFASLDNPAGDGEVWTPHLWSKGVYGREFRRYAGSWHALAGVSLWNRGRRSAERGGRMVGPEAVVGLEWYRGYSPRGTFLDMRRRDHPRWLVVPSITLTL